MIKHSSISQTQLKDFLRSVVLKFAGNQRLKIYGSLHCASGKRMKRGHRVFFADEADALAAGYRPCGHCMKEQYSVWRSGT